MEHLREPASGRTIAVMGLAGLLLAILLLRLFGFLIPSWGLPIILPCLFLAAGAFCGLRAFMALRSGEVSWVADWNWKVKTFSSATAPGRYWAATIYFAVLSIIFTASVVLMAITGKISN